MHRYSSFIIAIIAIALYAASGWLWPKKPLPLDAIKREHLAKKSGQTTWQTVHINDLPGPDGKRLSVSFYGLERLPLPPGDLCSYLSDRRERAKTQFAAQKKSDPDVFTDADLAIKRACTDTVDDEDQPIGPAMRGALAVQAASALSSLDSQPTLDRAFGSLLMRWTVESLKAAKSVDDVNDVIKPLHIFNIDDDGVEGLIFKRFYADGARLRAALCPTPDTFACHANWLVTAGKGYSRVGRLEDHEQHFHDMTTVLDEAEPWVKAIASRGKRLDLLDDMASAFGYAGEAGRSETMLKRAADLSRRVVVEVEPAQNDQASSLYVNALEQLAANLGRWSSVATDKIAVLHDAINTGEKAIAIDWRVSPGKRSWTALSNLASSQRELFLITHETPLIEKSIANARHSLASFSEGADADYVERSSDVAYARANLAYSLAAQTRHVASMKDDEKMSVNKEARALLDQSEPVFRAINANAYLRMISRARALLPKEE